MVSLLAGPWMPKNPPMDLLGVVRLQVKSNTSKVCQVLEEKITTKEQIGLPFSVYSILCSEYSFEQEYLIFLVANLDGQIQTEI